MLEFLIANALYVGMALVLLILIAYGSWSLYVAGAHRGYLVAQSEREHGYAEDRPRPQAPPRQPRPRPHAQPTARSWSLNDIAGYLSAVVVMITLAAVLIDALLPLPAGVPTGSGDGEVQPQPTAPRWSPPPAGQPQPPAVAPAAAPPVEQPASELIPIVEPAPAVAPPPAAPPAEQVVSDLVPIVEPVPTPYWGQMNSSGGSFDAAPQVEPTPLPEGVYWGEMNRSGGAVEQPTAASGGGRSGGGWGNP